MRYAVSPLGLEESGGLVSDEEVLVGAVFMLGVVVFVSGVVVVVSGGVVFWSDWPGYCCDCCPCMLLGSGEVVAPPWALAGVLAGDDGLGGALGLDAFGERDGGEALDGAVCAAAATARLLAAARARREAK